MVLSVAACTPAQEQNHGSGFIAVDEIFWSTEHDTPYPFTTDGEISCSIHPEFGPAVYFEPVGFVDESSIGTPLNKAAAELLKQAGMTSNVPYSIKRDADLSEARALGLEVCNKQEDVTTP